MKRRLLISAFFLLCVVVPLQAQNLSKVIEWALEQNNEIKAQGQALQKAQLEARAQFRKTLPALEFNAAYRHQTLVPQINFPSVFPGGGAAIHIGTYDTYETGLRLYYVLFSGFRLTNSVRMARQKSVLQAVQLENKKREIAFNVLRAYRQVQLQQVEVEVLNAAMKRIDLQRQRLNSLIRQGFALSLDTLSLELARLQLKSRLIAARGNIATALQQLNQLAGKQVKVEPFTSSVVSPPEVELQIEKTPPYRSVSQQEKLQQLAAKIARAAYLPSVTVYASYNYGKPGLDIINNQWNDYGIWGVNVSWNLFNWNGDRLTEQAALASAQQVAYKRAALKDQLKTRFDTAFREWQALAEQLSVFRAAQNVALTKMNLVQSRYQKGMATANDFNQANLELSEAELNLKRHLIRMALKKNEIEYLGNKPLNEWSLE